jgi:hypothetical protein
MQYRCYFFGANGQLVGAETIVRDNDIEAQVTARQLFGQRAFAVGYDLRQGRRSVEAQEAKAS